jgi:hypothetical protein
MHLAKTFIVVALIGVGTTEFTSRLSAQDSARDTAIHKCIIEAQARFPNVSDENTMRARTDVYRSCMRAAGQNP